MSDLAALATALAGVVTLVSSLSPSAPARARLLEALEPDAAQAVAHVAGVLGGAVVLWLALGVRQGRRPASRAAVVVLGVLAVVHAAKGLDYEEALIGLAVAAALHRLLRAGRRGEDASPVLLAGLAAAIAFAGAYAVTLSLLLVSDHAALGAAAVQAARMALWAVPAAGLGGPAQAGAHVAVATALGLLAVLLRALVAPARVHDGHDALAHRRAAALVAEHGADSIAPFALRADKAFHFAHGGVLAYRTLRETAVIAGDPVGPPGCAGPVLRSFLDHARRQGWDVTLLGAREESLEAYAALGLRTMQVGIEAVVDPRAFTLEGRAARTVRKAVARVRRHGWTVEVVPGADVDAGVAQELLEVERAWRRTHRRLYGFAMAGDRLWGAPEDVSDVYAIARDASGAARAFQRYVRYGRGLSLDAMRRLDDEPNGISDSLVAAVLAHARGLGLEEVSLNFSAFGHLTAAEALERRRERLARRALRCLQGRFQLERLVRFARKFEPEWRRRYLVYTTPARLPLVALRILQAEAYVKPPPRRPARDAWLPAPTPVSAGWSLTVSRR